MRVELNEASELDRDLIAANLADVAHHRPWAAPFTDEAGFAAWLARPSVRLVARERGTGAPVGVINLNTIVPAPFQNATLGYWGYSATAGRGLMTQALELAVRAAFDRLGLHRLEANIQPGNLRSIALVKRLGFRLEGFSPRFLFIDGAWRDHERWALLSDEG